MKKVVIGMSGGVDSSVAAYLLKEQGYEVIGLFMRNWDSMINNDIMGNPTLKDDICSQEQDYNDALIVCNSLDIPLHRVDFVKEYYKKELSQKKNWIIKKGNFKDIQTLLKDILQQHPQPHGRLFLLRLSAQGRFSHRLDCILLHPKGLRGQGGHV